MAKQSTKVPGAVLQTFMDDYQLNPGKLGAGIKVNQTSIRNIVSNKAKISVPLALRLAKFFGNTAREWIDLQIDYELADAGKDADLQKEIKEISKAKKPPAPKEEVKAKGRGRPAKAKDAGTDKEAKPRKPRAPKDEKEAKAPRKPRKPRTPKMDIGQENAPLALGFDEEMHTSVQYD